MAKTPQSSLKYVHFGLSFGMTMAVSIYFGFKGGMWLDNYLNSQPFFMFIGTLLGIGVSFKSLMDNLKRIEKK
ncbi:MAG: AtpZ/AtpI family protein [Peptococcaceae bacterium]